MKYSFHKDVKHTDIDTENWMGVFIVGDVHGCKRELEALVENSPISENDLVLFVGDLVRKGPKSDEVVEMIRNADNMFSVMGNNEWKVVNREKYKDVLEDEANRKWISNLPYVITVDSVAVVHGGFDSSIPISEHRPVDIMTMRSPEGGGYQGELWYENYEGEPRVFAGHTVHNKPYIGDSCACIDTGCIYGGELTAVRLEDDCIFQVDSEKDVNRSDRGIIYRNSSD